MSEAIDDDLALNYQVYRFGRARQFFRGPAADLSRPYIAFIGGAETFGKFATRPFADILRDELPVGVANWGTPDAGPTFYLKDSALLEACSEARLCVISLTNAFSMSNRLYSVFPRRNSCLLEVSPMLQALYPDIGFGKFRFVRPMLTRLEAANAANFKVVELEIKRAWVARMRDLLGAIEAPKILLWMSDHTPENSGFNGKAQGIGPQMIDRGMIDELRGHCGAVVEYVAPDDVLNPDGGDRVFEEGDLQAALRHPGGEMHLEAAELLYAPIKRALEQPSWRARRAQRKWAFLGLKI